MVLPEKGDLEFIFVSSYVHMRNSKQKIKNVNSFLYLLQGQAMITTFIKQICFVHTKETHNINR
jgi:hypothetical protein